MPSQYITKTYLNKQLKKFGENMDAKFEEVMILVKTGFDEMGERIDRLDIRVQALEVKVDALEKRVSRIEALMVDKDYLDRKLAEFKWELLAVLRKEDDKFNLLVQILKDNKILKDKDLSQLQEIVIFPVWKKTSQAP